MKLPLIPQDKANHMIYGALLFALGFLIMLYAVGKPQWAGIGGFGLAAFFGVAKEVYDYRNQEAHTPDPMDFFYTVVGGLYGWLMTGV